MKLITAAILTVTLSGCIYQEVDQNDIIAATEACADKGGVFNIREYFAAGTMTTCKDSSYIQIDNLGVK